MELFKAFHVDINLENQFQIFIIFKVILKEVFWAARIVPHETLKITYHTIIF